MKMRYEMIRLILAFYYYLLGRRGGVVSLEMGRRWQEGPQGAQGGGSDVAVLQTVIFLPEV